MSRGTAAFSTVTTGGSAAAGRGGASTTRIMAASPAGPAAWSVAVRLRHRGGLEIRASAENVLPGWGRGGERLSLLLRLRRRLILAVTSQCGSRSPATGTPLPGCKILRFLRTGWARVPPIWPWRRKNRPPVRASAISAAVGARSKKNRSSTQTIQGNRAWTPPPPPPAAALWFAVTALAVVLASIAVFYLKGGRRGGGSREPIAHCASWRCFLAHFLEPPSLGKYKWLFRVLKWLLHRRIFQV